MPAKILIVEDEAITAIDIKDTLEKRDFEVVSIVSDGKEAIKKAEEHKPDLILMDIFLNGEIDGIEAARKIMTFLDVPVIYLSAFCDKKAFQRAKLTEPYSFLSKPFNSEKLISFIDTALYIHKFNRKLKDELVLIA
jgi:CheY-like chemotaxis protein